MGRVPCGAGGGHWDPCTGLGLFPLKMEWRRVRARPSPTRPVPAVALLPQALLLLQLQHVRGARGGRGGRARLPGAGGTDPAPPQPGAQVGVQGGLMGSAGPFGAHLQLPTLCPTASAPSFSAEVPPAWPAPALLRQCWRLWRRLPTFVLALRSRWRPTPAPPAHRASLASGQPGSTASPSASR